jgi:hypothetical protein
MGKLVTSEEQKLSIWDLRVPRKYQRRRPAKGASSTCQRSKPPPAPLLANPLDDTCGTDERDKELECCSSAGFLGTAQSRYEPQTEEGRAPLQP